MILLNKEKGNGRGQGKFGAVEISWAHLYYISCLRVAMKIFQVRYSIVMAAGKRLLGDLRTRFEILIYLLSCLYKCETFVKVTVIILYF